MAETQQLMVRIESDLGAEDDERDELARQLHEELLDSDAEDVELVYGSVPAGAKAIDGSIVGLSVTVLAGGMAPLLTMLHSWVSSRNPRCTVRVEGPQGSTVEIPNVPLDRLKEVMAQWAQPSG